MSTQGMRAQNHPLQVAARGAVDETDDRATVPEVFDPLHERFGFTVDVAAAAHNAKCARWYGYDEDGAAQSWADEVVWCNPPFSDIRRWVEKAWAEYTRTRGIVMLLPANRTEQPWWQELVEPYRDRQATPHGPVFSVEFLPGGAPRRRPDMGLPGAAAPPRAAASHHGRPSRKPRRDGASHPAARGNWGDHRRSYRRAATRDHERRT